MTLVALTSMSPLLWLSDGKQEFYSISELNESIEGMRVFMNLGIFIGFVMAVREVAGNILADMDLLIRWLIFVLCGIIFTSLTYIGIWFLTGQGEFNIAALIFFGIFGAAVGGFIGAFAT